MIIIRWWFVFITPLHTASMQNDTPGGHAINNDRTRRAIILTFIECTVRTAEVIRISLLCPPRVQDDALPNSAWQDNGSLHENPHINRLRCATWHVSRWQHAMRTCYAGMWWHHAKSRHAITTSYDNMLWETCYETMLWEHAIATCYEKHAMRNMLCQHAMPTCCDSMLWNHAMLSQHAMTTCYKTIL
jgi:hypothetical protein